MASSAAAAAAAATGGRRRRRRQIQQQQQQQPSEADAEATPAAQQAAEAKQKMLLSSLPHYDAVWRSAAERGELFRPEGTNVDLVTAEFPAAAGIDVDDEVDYEFANGVVVGNSTTPETETTIGICHLAALHYFTNNGEYHEPTYEDSIAIALAAHQLNTATTSSLIDVVRDDSSDEYCPIKFTVEFADTQLQEGPALKKVIEMVSRSSARPHLHRRPCAFLGAYRSAVSIPTSIVTSAQGYPQVSGYSTSSDLDSVNQYPLFGRTITSDSMNAVPIIKYFHRILGVRHLSVLHVNDEYGNFFAEGLRQAARKYADNIGGRNMTIYTVDIPPPDESNPDSIRNSVALLREKGYTYVFGIMFETRLFDAVMEEAYNQGIAGDGLHNWFFSDSFNSALLNRPFPRESPLCKAYQGVGLLEASGGMPGQPRYDAFVEKLRQIRDSPADMEYLSNILPPRSFGGGDGSVNVTTTTPFIYDDDFLNPVKSGYVSFVYEAAMAVGLAACDVARNNLAAASAGANGSGLPSQSAMAFNGSTHFEQIKRTEFASMSGNVLLDKTTGTRDASGILFKVTNHVAVDDGEDMSSNGRNSSTVVYFTSVVTDLYQDGQWSQVDGNNYTFNDGTFRIPADLPPQIVEQDFFDRGLQITSYVMLALLWAAAALCVVWTVRKQNTRVVRASQPIFLHMICAGVIVLASSIVPSAIDNSHTSIQGCNVACNLFPWLLSLGFTITFSALYTKAYRVSVILANANRFRHVQVTIRDVIKPMILHLGANVIVLSLMTALAPSLWVIEVSGYDVYGRPSSIYGRCSISNERGAYLIALLILNLVALIVAIILAWKTQKLSTEFSEAKYIFTVFLTILFVSIVGVPVLILASDNPDASVFVMNAIVFVIGITTLLWIFVPKVKSSLEPQSSRTIFRDRGSVRTGSSDDAMFLEPSVVSNRFLYGSRVANRQTMERLEQEVVELRRLLQVASIAAAGTPVSNQDQSGSKESSSQGRQSNSRSRSGEGSHLSRVSEVVDGEMRVSSGSGGGDGDGEADVNSQEKTVSEGLSSFGDCDGVTDGALSEPFEV